MGLESTTYLNGLVATNPTATDSVAQADDHIRLIKGTLVNTFPNLNGQVVSTVHDMNNCSGAAQQQAVTLTNNEAFVVNHFGFMKQVNISALLPYLNTNLTVTISMITDGTIQSVDIANGAVTLSKLASDAQGLAVPSGSIMPYAGQNAPANWLLCYGQSVSRTTYADLFAAIGTTYGADDSVTFKLPDLRGRVIAGQDDMGGTSANRLTSPLNGDTLGGVGGAETHTLTTSELPAHSHTGNVALRTNWESGTSSKSPVGTGNARYDGSGSFPDFTTDNSGGGGAHANVQPTIILNYIIKT